MKKEKVIQLIKEELVDVFKEDTMNETSIKQRLNKAENVIFTGTTKYRQELPEGDAQKDFLKLRDAFFKGIDSIVKKYKVLDQ
jgi:hypothetical protein